MFCQRKKTSNCKRDSITISGKRLSGEKRRASSVSRTSIGPGNLFLKVRNQSLLFKCKAEKKLMHRRRSVSRFVAVVVAMMSCTGRCLGFRSPVFRQQMVAGREKCRTRENRDTGRKSMITARISRHYQKFKDQLILVKTILMTTREYKWQ